jgi:hypothetical protein
VVIRVIDGFDPALAQTPTDVFFLETGARLQQCGEGLATGEGEGGLAIACDLTAGLVAFLTIPTALRDLAVVGTNFAEGKRTTGDYVKAAGAVVVIVASAIPVLRTVVRAISRASRTAAETSTMKAAVAAIHEIAKTGSSDIPSERLIRLLADEPDLAAPFLDLAGKLRDPDLAFGRLRRLSELYGEDDVLRTVLELAPKVEPQTIEKFLDAATRIGKPLSKPALEGMAFFIQRGPKNAGLRVAAYWKLLERFPQKRDEVFSNTFTWIREAELNGIAKIDGWDRFLQKGFGTVSDSNIGLNAAAGAYQVLQHLAVDLKWSAAISKLETSVRAGSRVVDLTLNFGDGVLTRREIKNLLETSGFSQHFRSEVIKDIKLAIEVAIRDAGGIQADRFEVELTKQLQHVQYLFRGNNQQMQHVVSDLRGVVRKTLGPALEHLEFYVSTLYSSRTLPF